MPGWSCSGPLRLLAVLFETRLFSRRALLPTGRTGRTVEQAKSNLWHRAQGVEVAARSHRSLSS